MTSPPIAAPLLCGFIDSRAAAPAASEDKKVVAPSKLIAPPPLEENCIDAPPEDGVDQTHITFKQGGLCRSASCRYCDNTKILKITVESNVTSMPAGAFWGCTSLNSIDWGDSKVTTVGAYAFQETAFTDLILPSSLTKIEVGAFSSCKYLKSILFPPSLEKILRGSFQATGVKHVKLEGEIKEIGDYAFIHCNELETVEVTTEEGVMTKIGKGAFAYCKNLRSVTLNCRLSSVGEFAFSDCKNLEDVVWPKACGGGVEIDVGDKIFQTCDKLHEKAGGSSKQKDILAYLSKGNNNNNNVEPPLKKQKR
ncbi:hypothetical protein TrLO_g10528 [Triparma laevis f. longispina]|uniref:Leucine-rich repeat domain-containing protein n=1 Tax=Triparma laevis f. longispina TaxID=1714387 RepID=A0A9W7FSQ6_9STRA|nr:hypothetical protein TrLO_g10528 [Triparma laevis f. longispina]